ncbi:hypothetical protein B0I32_13148 [Nonomuraea fuscirosea]|uniref:Uncharacterized protein n=1 Tax=Nonomuraea fuscirosea TaxID=1291556 RepID=A0A2T0M5C7_9ACTN|nr:hypothetical protein B0I32_13148 [Nonomuraea fuscirosea]
MPRHPQTGELWPCDADAVVPLAGELWPCDADAVVPLAADVWTYLACHDDRRLVPAEYALPAGVRRDDPPPLLPNSLFRPDG